MADVDVLIRPPDHGAPLNYAVSNVAEIVPKSVRAIFDGTGAGGPFLPCLVFLSPQGHELARCPVGTPVVAGASAEVSWFPGGKLAAGAVASQLAYARGIRNAGLFGDPGFSVNAGSSVAHPFPHITASDATVFQWVTAVNPNDQLHLLKSGLYSLVGASQWTNANFNRYSRLDTPNDDLGLHGVTPAAAFFTSNPFAVGGLWTLDATLLHVTFTPATLFLRVFNGDVIPEKVLNASLGVIFHGTP